MKGILEFDLSDPEQREEFDKAVKAPKYSLAIWDIKQEIFRPARKHGYSDSSISSLIEKIDAVLEKSELKDKDGNTIYSTDLIGALETNFYEILNNYQVNDD